MSAPLRAKTMVGHLLYPERPSLNFRRLVADLDAALAGAGAEEWTTTLARDGLAVIDAGTSRIAVAMAENLDTRGATAITVTVGVGPEEAAGEGLARKQAVLARLIADRVAARTPPTETIWTESDEVATPEFLERRAEDLAARRRTGEDVRSELAEARRVRPRRFVDLEDLPRLMARVEATLDARRTKWDESTAVDLPPMDLSGLVDDAVEPKAASAPLRMAAHLIDATVMVLLLPVGAAMMVYSLTRGADLNTSARVMTLTALGMGAAHLSGGLDTLGTILTTVV
jgi:hypothetical protein